MAKRALGKGLGAIISSSQTPVQDIEKHVVESAGSIVELEIEKIKPNPDQPRIHFDSSEIKGLSESIKAMGLLQPIIVRKVNDNYFIVAGERRLRATKEAGFNKIKSIIIEADEEKNLTLALIENIQRSNLDPIEEAKAYKMLVSKFKLKQQEIAEKVGKERATIANLLRLLNLPEEIQSKLSSGELNTGHAKILLSIQNKQKQFELFELTINEGLSVRALENKVKDLKQNTDQTTQEGTKKSSGKSAHIKKMEDKLISHLGTKVEIKHSSGKGKIEISYYSLEDFDRVVDIIKG